MRKPPSPRTTACIVAITIGFGVFAVGCLGDALLLASGATPWLAVLDDLAIGLFAAAMVLFYEWRRDATLRNQLRIIAEMHHHIRNQLEIIEYSAWETHNKAHIARMQQSASHIAWALREILGHDHPDAPPPPAKAPSSVGPPLIEAKQQSAD